MFNYLLAEAIRTEHELALIDVDRTSPGVLSALASGERGPTLSLRHTPAWFVRSRFAWARRAHQHHLRNSAEG